MLECHVTCPYCGESIEILVDDSVSDSDYYEDCSVCCRPIRVQASIDVEGGCQIVLLRDDE
ncbi:MAG: CPXCG motif-containing cysteine-rich protein [Gammaproteobacteria bacterium]|nr:MAG: CPXCG motif-containing cysteine-rich protein [Gammaproteobacteria bacterium]